MKTDYSIVIPAFNEQARIGATLDDVIRCVETYRWNAEVIVVDDGSTDKTAAIVRAIAAQCPYVRLLPNETNRGKGYSVRNGILHASGDIVLFTDADLSSPIEEAHLLYDAIRHGADLAIGSRWLAQSRQTIRQPLYRRFFGRCFNIVTRMIMRLPYADTQCGFKAFTHQAAQTIFQLQRIERWGFDPEILFIARKRGYTVREVPVTWGHDERSRISYLRDGLQMLKELLLVRWNALIGIYGRSVPDRSPQIPAVKRIP
ncbi:MAG TPA: dolichyl-phosphate beta-glucosyltransferase [Silvibacterium sp.]|nr:dolichyl-phosphate beta-glucosyltransferase [Silvibacterium sp.]